MAGRRANQGRSRSCADPIARPTHPPQSLSLTTLTAQRRSASRRGEPPSCCRGETRRDAACCQKRTPADPVSNLKRRACGGCRPTVHCKNRNSCVSKMAKTFVALHDRRRSVRVFREESARRALESGGGARRRPHVIWAPRVACQPVNRDGPHYSQSSPLTARTAGQATRATRRRLSQTKVASQRTPFSGSFSSAADARPARDRR